MNARIVEARECLQSLRAAISSVEWKTFRRMIGRKSLTELDVLRIHSELGEAIATVVMTAIGPAIDLLGAQSKSGAEMLSIVRLFIAELRARW